MRVVLRKGPGGGGGGGRLGAGQTLDKMRGGGVSRKRSMSEQNKRLIKRKAVQSSGYPWLMPGTDSAIETADDYQSNSISTNVLHGNAGAKHDHLFLVDDERGGACIADARCAYHMVLIERMFSSIFGSATQKIKRPPSFGFVYQRLPRAVV